MNPQYIEIVIKKLDEVLITEKENISESTQNTITEAKNALEEIQARQSGTAVSTEDKANYLQIIILVMEIFKSIADHYK